jgi:hypothetical protein
MVYVQDKTSKQIFESAVEKDVSENLKIPFVSPEHLIAMKLSAIKNNPKRKLKELSDIQELLKRIKLDKKVVKDYFKKYNLEHLYEEIPK